MDMSKTAYMKKYNLGYRAGSELSEEERLSNVERMYKNSREWYHRNKEKVAEKRKKKYQDNPIPRLFYHAKVRAKKSNIPFSLTVQDMPDMPDVCPITQEEFGYDSPKKGVASYRAPSLDRIDNSKGYIPGNVRIISYQANYWKNNMNVSHVERLLKYMKGEI